MSDEQVKRITVKPATNPETGDPYYTWHPSVPRKAIPAEGASVPLDMYTQRYLRDGTWVALGDEPAPDQPAAESRELEPQDAQPIAPMPLPRWADREALPAFEDRDPSRDDSER